MRASFENGLWVCEFTESPFAVISAHTGMPGSIERNTFHHHMDTYFVDTTSAELLGLHYSIGPLHVLRKQIHCQGVFALRYHVHEFVHFRIFERHNRQERAEKFMLHNMFVDFHRIDYRRCILTRLWVAHSSKNNAVSILIGQLRALVKCRISNQFRVFRIGFRMLADLGNKSSLQFLYKLFGDLFSDCYLVDIDAYLSGIKQFEESNLTRSICEVGIFISMNCSWL